jgi:hypothetical protein
MGFDYRELTRQILFAQGGEDDQLGCEQCSTTKGIDHRPCNQCSTTKHHDDDDKEHCTQCSTTRHPHEDEAPPPCNQCSTTKPPREESGSRYAQDLTFLRQQLQDALAAG